MKSTVGADREVRGHRQHAFARGPMTPVRAIALAVTMILGASGGADAAPFVLKDLGTLGGTYADVFAVNNNGQVAGGSAVAGTNARHAFLSAPGGGALVDLGTFGGSVSVAYGLNDAGRAVGYAATADDADFLAYLSAPNPAGPGQLVALSTSPGAANAINALGQVAGSVLLPGASDSHAFITAPNGGAVTDLGTLTPGGSSVAYGINASGQATGAAYGVPGDEFAVHAFVSAPHPSGPGQLIDLGTLGGSQSYGFAINDRGQVAGYSSVAGDATMHAFVTAPNSTTLVDLGTLGGGFSRAYDINESGQVVGYSSLTAGQPNHAFLYTGRRMVDLVTLTGNGALSYAAGINDYAQIAGALSSGRAFLLTLHPSWSAPGGGAWDDSANWDFGGAGELVGLTPGKPHDVVINPSAAGTVTGPAGNALIRTLTIGGNGGTVALNLQSNATLQVTNGVSVAANATLGGTGVLQGDVKNAGSIRALDGQTLRFAGGSVSNAGTVLAIGLPSSLAKIFFGAGITNTASGRIILQNAVFQGGGPALPSPLTKTGGTSNAGQILVSGDANAIFGAIDNLAGASIVLSGAGRTSFYDTVRNNGTLRVSAGSIATFFGLVTGAGSYTGTGASFYEGTFHVGNSPAQVTTTNAVTFDALSLLDMDLAGTSGPGTCKTCYSQLVFDNDVQFAGGTLQVNLYNGFVPHAGDAFTLFAFHATHGGALGSLLLPALGAGLAWDTSALYTLGDLKVAAVPLPGALWLMAGGLVVALRRRA